MGKTPIPTRKLSRSGLEISTLGLGSAALGGLYAPLPDAQAHDLVNAALDAGIRYFDTAPFYGAGLAERRVGDPLRNRADVVVSTKAGRILTRDRRGLEGQGDWAESLPFKPVFDYSYDSIMRSFEDSCHRMGRIDIDILFLHDIGDVTHRDPEISARHFSQAMNGGLRALEELRKTGDIKAFGIGVNETEVLMAAMEYGQWDVFLLAGRYTLLERVAALPLLEACTRQGTGVVIGGVFNSGLLVGENRYNYDAVPDAIRAEVARLDALCTKHDVLLPAAAMQFPARHKAVVSTLIGSRSSEQLEQALDWAKAKIPDAFWQELSGSDIPHTHPA